ncbi:MAG: hypothetical protein ABJM43_11790 [Paracoccaceae bacterium]
MEAETINAFEQFLKWGPIGLAGLMLVLVIFSLVLGPINPARERILKTFMYIGAACFVAALISQYFDKEEEYRLVLSVLPNDLDGSDFPPPKISLNGAGLERGSEILISETASLSIDVSRALGLFSNTKLRASSAEAETQRIEVQLMNAQTEAERKGVELLDAMSMVAILEEENNAKEFSLTEAQQVIRLQEARVELVQTQFEEFSEKLEEAVSKSREEVVLPGDTIKEIAESFNLIERAMGAAVSVSP